MRWIAGLILAAFANSAVAQETAGGTSCEATWRAVSEAFMATGAIQVVGTTTETGQDACEFTDIVVDMDGQYAPDWYVDSLHVTGELLPFLAGIIGTGAMESLTPGTYGIDVKGLRIVVQTGNAQLDWLYAAQSRPNKIDANVVLTWDAIGKTFRVEALNIDFPGDNLLEFSALAKGVDLSSTGAMQMSATGFAVTEADLRVRTHGLFEWYVLMPFGPMYLPMEGDMDTAAAGLRAEMTAAVADLPGASFSSESRAALTALIAELPNPSGELTIALRSEAGIGPARLGGYAVTGAPSTVAETAPLMQGVTVDIGWSHSVAQ
jgi:hypothetical protein